MAPNVSIIIPTLNEGENLRRLIPALRSQAASFEFEIIVIDSGSTDSTLAVCEELGVKTLEIPKGTFNHGGTRLTAAREAAGSILVFTVGDALPADENWLANLVGPVLEDERVAGCYGIQVGPTEPLVNPLEQNVSVEQEIAVGLTHGPHATLEESTGRVRKRVDSGQRFEDLTALEQRRMACFDNCNSCVRKTILLDEVPFESVTFGEDYQWAAKVLGRGYTVVFEPRAKVFHYHVQGFRYFFRRMWLDQKIVEDVFELPGHRTMLESMGAWRREVGSSWTSLGKVEGLGFGGRLKWFGHNLKLITANRLARYLTEAEGRRHPMGWLANRVQKKLGRVVTIRRPG